MSSLLFSGNKLISLPVKISLICLLSACSPDFISVPPSVPSTPGISGHTFTSYDNTKLPLKAWLPDHEIEGVIIAVHGFNDYSNFIKDAALFFNKKKLAVYSYDQRGFGETESRGRWSGRQALSSDLITLVKLIKERHLHKPIYVLGDSMGGAVSIVAMAEEGAPAIGGVILVAPAVWTRSEMPFYQRWILWLASHTIPWKKVTGKYLEITASDNIEMLKELGRDPLVIKETRIDVLYGLSNLMDEAYNSAELLRASVLVLYGKKDEIIPEKPVFEFYNRLPAGEQGQQEMILYDNGYHMLTRDLQAETVIKDIVYWINGYGRHPVMAR